MNSAQLDPAAFADFHERCEHPVLWFFMRATRRSDLAADLTAETFARALESIAVYDRCRGRADQWLFVIARNVLGESLRRGRVDAESRRRLGMPTLVLDDHTTDTIARLSSGQGEASVARCRSCPPSSAKRSRRGSSMGASTHKSLSTSSALRQWFASG